MDEAAKRHRVEKIDSEVGELHPLLESILRQLANVQYVEYTHGPNELGADFVVERRDEDLGRNSYIGVVAKTDKILQSFADVERQIDECGDARLIKGGMETVRLPEVWVVTSKSISQNAKQRIEEKFKTRKIHFFESDWLVTQIDRHAPHFWEEIDGATGKYLAKLDKRLDVISAQTAIATSPQISNLQMEIDVEEVESDRYLQSRKPMKPRLVNLKEEVLRNKISIVEAEMGFGKSHLARKLGAHFSSVEIFKTTQTLPIFASFKAYADSAMSLDDFLEQHAGKDCLDHVKAANGKILLILDGVDEAASNQEFCKVKATELIKEVRNSPSLSLVLTSRPWKALGEMAAEHGGVKKYRIRPLSVGKIITYLRRVLETMKMPDRLVNDLANSALFKQLPHNPIAATLLANIVKQEKYELPSNLTELYAKTVELMLGRWDERREIATEKQYKATERLARLLARHMIDNQLVYISKAEIKQMFGAFLADRQTGVSLDETFDYLINRSAIFGVFEDTDAVFFKHRSFAEYLYAKDAFQARDLEINKRAYDVYWTNTYFFYVGTRAECPDLIDALVSVEVTEISHRVHRMLSIGKYMLAGYETHYAHIQKALDIVFIEAARLYLDIKSGRLKSGLIGLTEMQLLWFFTQAIRGCYGYEFFKTGLPISMARIDDTLTLDDEARSYALFFAACSLADLEDTCGFTYLLQKDNPTTLPISISFALQCEMGYGTKDFAHSKPVKDFSKKLKKLLQMEAGAAQDQSARLKLLFHEPLSAKVAKSAAAEAKKQAPAKSRPH